ncbi:hypothetical protein FL857_08385 [Criibacterium bergeronii]|uniref:Site-specific recombinase n=1 Tax=Criibacterium bergeronii TaxID=1871336 RepID=A0A552V3D3_9FIRM|nr:hypothetical protein [Criibacterium bergeronii]TRW24961.1 hypothetical protein FL857_08385 [Criibacterium bergeronii]
MRAINTIIENKESIRETLKTNIQDVLLDNADSKVSKIEEKMLSLQKELIKKANARENYDDLTQAIEDLREQKRKVYADLAEKEGINKRIKEMRGFLDSQNLSITNYDEELVRKLIDKVVVYDDEIKIVFKSGIEV